MGSNPINLALRFVLEMVALLALGKWGWQIGEGGMRYILALATPVLAAALWGTFAVPDDPSRSGKAPVPVPGLVRLLLELSIFALALWAVHITNSILWSWILGAAITIHYLASYDRVLWLIRTK